MARPFIMGFRKSLPKAWPMSSHQSIRLNPLDMPINENRLGVCPCIKTLIMCARHLGRVFEAFLISVEDPFRFIAFLGKLKCCPRYGDRFR